MMASMYDVARVGMRDKVGPQRQCVTEGSTHLLDNANNAHKRSLLQRCYARLRTLVASFTRSAEVGGLVRRRPCAAGCDRAMA